MPYASLHSSSEAAEIGALIREIVSDVVGERMGKKFKYYSYIHGGLLLSERMPVEQG